MAHRNLPRPAAVYGIDIGKNVFHVVGLSRDGTPVQKVRFRRDTLLQFFARADPSIVGIEACAGSQWLAPKVQALGHTVRLIRAQFVKPYVKSNKNDIVDAEAIAEATTNGVTTPCTDGADHTFFPKRSFKAALSSTASARSRFSFVFSSSSVFSRLTSDTSMPPNLAFHL